MKSDIRQAFNLYIQSARESEAAGEYESAFRALEYAHIVGQRYLIPHIKTHFLMFKLGFKMRSTKEMVGQIVRILATVPGFIFGWIPKGNTGGANVSALKPMPIPTELNHLLSDYSVWKDVLIRLLLFVGLSTIFMISALIFDYQHRNKAILLESEWQQQQFSPVVMEQSTSDLRITPLVNFKASPGFKSEPGVSYLIETDNKTILFDLGFNQQRLDTSPLEYNMAKLGITSEDIDIIFISHPHRDHLGGVDWEKQSSFGFGFRQPDLGDTKIYSPNHLSYPGSTVNTVTTPRILEGPIASSGPIPRQLVIGKIEEQALIINLENKGLVVVVGCGHQTLKRLITHIERYFDQPIYALVGDVHYPIEGGRLFVWGIDAQRRLASGDGIFGSINEDDVQADLKFMSEKLSYVALGSHDTSDKALSMAQSTLGDRFHEVIVGRTLVVK